jgi:hypothetical protein
MDLLKFQASIDAHTAALVTHSATMEKFMAVAAAGTGGGAAATGEAPRRGRPTAAEAAAKLAAQAASSATTQAPTSTVTVAAPASGSPASTATVTDGPLTHLALKDLFTSFAKTNGREKLVLLLGEFGATEFGKVKVDDLPLFRDRLLGKPQTPVQADDFSNLLGLTG